MIENQEKMGWKACHGVEVKMNVGFATSKSHDFARLAGHLHLSTCILQTFNQADACQGLLMALACRAGDFHVLATIAGRAKSNVTMQCLAIDARATT